MRRFLCSLALAAAAFLPLQPASAADAPKHRIVFQVDSADPALMNLTLNNVTNLITYYRDKHEDVSVDIVAFGPGLNMYRADKSPVTDRIKHLADFAYPAELHLSACNNTKQAMEKAEGHAITLLPQATIVPSGVVQIVTREEAGWSYVRP